MKLSTDALETMLNGIICFESMKLPIEKPSYGDSSKFWYNFGIGYLRVNQEPLGNPQLKSQFLPINFAMLPSTHDPRVPSWKSHRLTIKPQPFSSMTGSLILRRSLSTTLRQCASVSISTRTAATSNAAINRLITTATSPRPPQQIHQHYPSRIQTRSLFIQTATTPNPESLKFLPGRLVLSHNPQESPSSPSSSESPSSTSDENDTNGFYVTRKDHDLIARSPLSKSLFALDSGIKSLYLGYDFITVTKFAEAKWSHLQTPIYGAIMDFYASNQPAVRGEPEITDTTILEEDSEVVAMIKELLESRIRPAVQEDGAFLFVACLFRVEFYLLVPFFVF
jgi:hypothetical protein